jgi:hypothetical protein
MKGQYFNGRMSIFKRRQFSDVVHLLYAMTRKSGCVEAGERREISKLLNEGCRVFSRKTDKICKI